MVGDVFLLCLPSNTLLTVKIPAAFYARNHHEQQQSKRELQRMRNTTHGPTFNSARVKKVSSPSH